MGPLFSYTIDSPQRTTSINFIRTRVDSLWLVQLSTKEDGVISIPKLFTPLHHSHFATPTVGSVSLGTIQRNFYFFLI